MTDGYQPELGQMLYGQPSQELKCNWQIESFISALQMAFNLAYPKLDNPFDNAGARYKWPSFTVHAYSWGDEEQPFNFKCGSFEVSWYKYAGRGTSCNMQPTDEQLQAMLRVCMSDMLNVEPVEDYSHD